MNEREKKLALAVGAMVALWAASIGWQKYQTALESNENAQLQVAQELSEAKTATLRGRRAQGKLRKWSKQSLPRDPDFAKALYEDWLRQQLTEAGLTVKSLDATEPLSSSRSYKQFTFGVSATGKLKQLTDFLYKFYQSKHLHRISQTTLSPAADDKQKQLLTISMSVDALALPSADREDQLASGNIETLKQPLSQFQEMIGGRDLFTKYEPPKPAVAEVDQPIKVANDEASKATFSGIHYGDSGWLMLVRMEETGKLLYFREGDQISIGQFQGTVEQLDGDQRLAVVLTGSQRVQVLFGKALSEAVPMRGRRS